MTYKTVSVTNLIKKIHKTSRHTNLSEYPVRVLQRSNPESSKWVLMSYLPNALKIDDNSSLLLGHSNIWESREIGRIFYEMGYNIEGISWNDFSYLPQIRHDVIFDICYNLDRLSCFYSSTTKKLLHCTGSDPYYQNSAELERVKGVNLRRKGQCSAWRMVGNPALATRSLYDADAISLLGNAYTLSTFPKAVQEKFTLIPVTGSETSNANKKRDLYVPSEREFLWFFGSGAIHKGLDLVLDVFKDHPEFHINIVGPIGNETDFVSLYYEELFFSPNIKFYGFLDAKSKEFRDLINRSFCFIAPTCSEGTSPAVVTCMQIGLFPIVSKDAGVDFDKGNGIILEECTYQSILDSVTLVFHMESAKLNKQIFNIQQYFLKKHSRESFRNHMQAYLSKVLP